MIRELLSEQLHLPLEYIDKVSRSASYRYKKYTVSKRSGGVRIIHHPAKELKAIQRWLLDAVIRRWPVHHTAYAYEHGRNIRSNAELHKKSNYLLRLDFADFFPSLTVADIQEFWKSNPKCVEGWSDEDKEFFLGIVCCRGRLTIGAPSSPRISNVLCRKLDEVIYELCKEEQVRYSRYADDLFFSCRKANVLRKLEKKIPSLLRKLKWPKGLQLNAQKTHHSSKKGCRVVTGMVVTQYGTVSVGRSRKRYVRSLIHKFDDLGTEDRHKLAGLLAFINGVEPAFINRLIVKYDAETVKKAMEMKE